MSAEQPRVHPEESLPPAEKKAALAGLEALEQTERLSSADIRAMVKKLGAMKAVLDQADRG